MPDPNCSLPKVTLETLYNRIIDGRCGPSPLKSTSMTMSHIREQSCIRTGKHPLKRPLEDFEDLYYALLAKVQDMYGDLRLRVNNSFIAPEVVLYKYGPNIKMLCTILKQYWTILNDPSFVMALDSAVRRSRIKYMHADIIDRFNAKIITKKDADELAADLYADHQDVSGLAWIGDWPPAMINTRLQEKYRVLLRADKQ
ncbi:hypothetical protein K469DRAFT_654166 [Zopfia rhizophila CBS 207.26]|uniref:Uncharacterized protein n=1 Tax=Zopfia rhizophila CBS 207.26 TaxID=1314779 RepID=A0A6A6EMN0_9PEZI|nr:hypothetical protein K469DRAFT_654166 [Zopfia rhizophila CBS 207.26]